MPRFILTLAFAMTVTSSVWADSVIYDQIGSQLQSSQSSMYRQQFDALSGDPIAPTDNRLADDFRLTEAATIKQITIGGRVIGGFDESGTLTGFNVYLYADNAGTPGSLITMVSGANLTTQELNVNKLYDVDISANPLSVDANTTYWVTVQGIMPPETDNTFTWNWANDGAFPSSYSPAGSAAATMTNGTLGNSWGRYDNFDGIDHGWAIDQFSGSLPSGWQAMDMSFSLTGTMADVPEPGTLAVLASGILGLLVYAWMKRK